MDALAEKVAPVEAPRTPEEIERHWFETVYQGDRMRQLTVRAVIMAMLLGMVMACSNVYVGLKAGWSMGVAITSCILAYTIFSGLHSTRAWLRAALLPVLPARLRFLLGGEPEEFTIL